MKKLPFLLIFRRVLSNSHLLIGFFLFSALVGVFSISIHPANGAADPPLVTLTPEERAWLDENAKNLPLFYNVSFPPIEFASPEGEFAGMGADVMARVEQGLGVRFPKVPSDDWNRHLQALESGECAIAPTIVSTLERERYAFFTIPYATVPVVIISARNADGDLTVDDLSGMRVAVVSGYASEAYLRELSRGRFEIIPMPDVSQGLRAASFGQVDVFVENLAVAAYYIHKEGIPNLRVAGSTDYAFAFSIGISRKYPLLFSAVQKSLAAIPQKEMEVIHDKWMSLRGWTGFSPETLRLMAIIAVFTALLLVGLSVITYVLKRRLKEKIASLKTSQQEVVESEARFRSLFSKAPMPLAEVSREGKMLEVNERFIQVIGYEIAEIPTFWDFWGMACPDREYRDRTAKAWETAVIRAVDSGFEIKSEEYRIVCKDGGERVMLMEASLIGERVLVGFVDLTDRKRSENERRKLREQLLQAQKLEAVGILAGGVAHDFNNILGTIIGYTELLMMEMDAADPAREKLEKILDASLRSANLVRQLLAFARKQEVSPKMFDVNDAVGAMLKMLRRLIGENIDLDWRPASVGGCTVNMDPSQFDQILANLCVNARNAIAGVGRISIKTASVAFDEASCAAYADCAPGEYVLLAVGDTGCGMDPETMKHIFEPFFTTREVGQGTGLGLATVYGIVKQNNGFIHVNSAPGAGAEFNIYLPRHADSGAIPKAATVAAIPEGRGETILVVEDDASILEMCRIMLNRLGYRVLAAATPGKAIRIAGEHDGAIDLFISDVVMPEMNGRELADRLLEIRPEMKHIFMSGYTADVILSEGVLDEEITFIQKPFSLETLAVKIRGTLDRD